MFNSWDREHFEAQGYLRLGQIATDAMLDAMRGRIDDLMIGRLPT